MKVCPSVLRDRGAFLSCPGALGLLAGSLPCFSSGESSRRGKAGALWETAFPLLRPLPSPRTTPSLALASTLRATAPASPPPCPQRAARYPSRWRLERHGPKLPYGTGGVFLNANNSPRSPAQCDAQGMSATRGSANSQSASEQGGSAKRERALRTRLASSGGQLTKRTEQGARRA